MSRRAAQTTRKANCPTRTWRPPPTTPPTSPKGWRGGAAKLFRVGLYCTVHARTEAELVAACAQVKAAAASTLLEVQPATWRHLAGWTTTLPLATDSLAMLRTMDTQALAAAFPLASPDLPAPLPGDEATTGGQLYGVNPDSGGIVWWDRWAQENYNSVVLARSGAGKSYFVKLEVLRSLYQGVRVEVIDPEDEYLRLADAVGGTVVQLGTQGVKLNPLDLPVGDGRPDVLTRRGLFLHTLIAALLGSSGREPALTPAMKAALDRGILEVYRQAGITPDPRTHGRPAPLLRDLAHVLDNDEDLAARDLAARLTPWTVGSFKDLRALTIAHQLPRLVNHDEPARAGTGAGAVLGGQVDLPPDVVQGEECRDGA